MAVLITGNSFTTLDQVTAATLNAATNSATFASGAVDGSTTQLSSGAIIVKDGGVTSSKLASSINVSGGIVTANRFGYAIDTAYATGGSIALNPDSKSLAYINLTSNPTFTFGTLSAGYEFKLILANNTVGTLTITWPAFVTGVGYTIPTSIVAGTTLVVDFISTGTTVGSLIATV
jgi:hypothetical protein